MPEIIKGNCIACMYAVVIRDLKIYVSERLRHIISTNRILKEIAVLEYENAKMS